jgi:hypothetical protein
LLAVAGFSIFMLQFPSTTEAESLVCSLKGHNLGTDGSYPASSPFNVNGVSYGTTWQSFTGDFGYGTLRQTFSNPLSHKGSRR